MINPRTEFNRNYIKSNSNSFLLLVSFLLISVNSCSKDNSQDDSLGEFNTKTLKHDGVERAYRVYLPNNYKISTPTPMVLALHGGGGTGANFEDDVSAGTLTAAAEARGIILVMPDGIDKRWNSGRPEIFNGAVSYDDVGFISQVIDFMIKEYSIDASRVYATGISNGGFMSVRLALELSDKLAAVAPVTAQMAMIHENKQPQLPISIMIVNGTEDPLVPFEGGQVTVPFLGQDLNRGEVLTTEATIDKFRGFNQCMNPAETDLLLDNIPDDGTEVEITKYDGCEQGTEIVLVKVIGGGHTWPSGAQYLPVRTVGVVSQEINASEMILDFFLSQSRN